MVLMLSMLLNYMGKWLLCGVVFVMVSEAE